MRSIPGRTSGPLIIYLPLLNSAARCCIGIYYRFSSFINKCNILTPDQYGFREGHSTSHALINFIRNVTNAIDNEEIMLGIFLDLSKAFDTLDHDILIMVYKRCCFRLVQKLFPK